MEEFSFPTNIKQIGSIGDGVRIYIEDYVATYLQQFAEAGGFDDRLAFLVGRSIVIDGQSVLFISGIVQGMFTTLEKDVTAFSDKSWQHAHDEVNKYFKGQDIVGWMQSQPGYGAYLNPNYAQMHKTMFSDDGKVMFVLDPKQKLSVFYKYDEATDLFSESGGYFVYYDRNRGMHEYMLDNKILKSKLKPLPIVSESSSPVLKQSKKDFDRQGIAGWKTDWVKPEWVKHDLGSEKKGSKLQEFKKRGSKAAWQGAKISKVWASATAILFLLTFVLSFNTFANSGKLASLETQLTEVNTAYRDLLLEIKNGKSEAVFNTQTSQTPKLIVENGNDVLASPSENADDVAEILKEVSKAAKAQQPKTQVQKPTQTKEPAQTKQPTQTPAQTKQPKSQEQPKAQASEPDASFEIPETYTVKIGDSLGSISIRFYGSIDMVQTIMDFNGIDDPDKVYFGKTIKLPNVD